MSNGDDGTTAQPPNPASDPDGEPTDPGDDDRYVSGRARLVANVALGLLVVPTSVLVLYGGSLSRLYAAFLLVSAPLLLGYRGGDAAPRPLVGIVAVAVLLLLGLGASTPVAVAITRLTGVDPVSARFAAEHAVDNAVTLAVLEGTLWAWLLAPAARALVSGSPPSLPGLPRPPRGARLVFVAVAVVVAVGTLSAAFAAGYHPVTTVETPGETYEHAGAAVTVTAVERIDCDARTCVTRPAGSIGGNDLAGEFVFVSVRAVDREHDDDRLLEDVSLVTPAAASDDRVRGRVDTVTLASGNPAFSGTEMPADRVRVDGRNYTVYDPDDRNGRAYRGWIVFRPPPGVDAGSYIRIQTTSPGPAGKWPLPAAG